MQRYGGADSTSSGDASSSDASQEPAADSQEPAAPEAPATDAVAESQGPDSPSANFVNDPAPSAYPDGTEVSAAPDQRIEGATYYTDEPRYTGDKKSDPAVVPTQDYPNGLPEDLQKEFDAALAEQNAASEAASV